MSNLSLATKLMIVNVSISVWEGRKLDKRVTRKTIADNNVANGKGLRVNKQLIEDEAFKEVQAASSAVRTFVKERTLPWKDNGDRALMRQGYQAFMFDFAKLRDDWVSAVDNFITVKYPEAHARASFNLGDAYDPNDYPHPEDLRGRFKISLDIDAVAEPEDFRVKLDDATVEEIQAQMRDAIGQRVHVAMQDVWLRVGSMVEHFMQRTTPDIQRFHDTTVTNLHDLVNLLPSLNLIGDPDLRALGKRLKATLCGYDPKDLRKNLQVREAAHNEAAQIMEDMAGFFNALSGN